MNAAGPPIYRLAMDDNIYFLRDIAKQGYRSLFECPYLAMLRDMHREHGLKCVLNIFYQTPEADFCLADFPDRYRAEWGDNAHWLRLAFHARQEFPSRPYKDATREELLADYDLVEREVLRFADKQAWTPTNVIHWCATPDALRPVLAERGVKVLSGLFRCKDGVWDAHYGLDAASCAVVAENHLLVDQVSGITMSFIDIVINNTALDQIAPVLERRANSPARARKVDLLSHEQYSWPFYSHYLPDHAERLAAASRWCLDHGYESAFFD